MMGTCSLCDGVTSNTSGHTLDECREEIDRIQDENTFLRAENERLRKALEHYADRDNWTNGEWFEQEGDIQDLYIPETHGYDIAQAALKEIAE